VAHAVLLDPAGKEERPMGTKRERVTVGVFDAPADARKAIEDLRSAKFSDRAIGVLTHDRDGDPEVRSFRDLEGNHAGAGAAIGIGAGAGGGALWALGIAAGILPAIGPVIAGGLLAAIAASAASGAAAGLLVGTLVGLGVSDEEAAYYDEEFRKGRTIVVIQGDDRRDLAQTILTAHHAHQGQVFAPTLADELAEPRI
jgi:Heat induced stress protein YflT